MIHRNGRWHSTRALRLIALVTVSAMAGPDTSFAFGVAATLPQALLIRVAEQTSATSAAQKTLNHICQVANQPHAPGQSLVGSFIDPADAQKTLQDLQSMSRTRRSPCPSAGSPPQVTLNTIEKIGKGVTPIYDPHHNFSSSIIRINEILGGYKAMETKPQ